jgi:hypothetical protein
MTHTLSITRTASGDVTIGLDLMAILGMPAAAAVAPAIPMQIPAPIDTTATTATTATKPNRAERRAARQAAQAATATNTTTAKREKGAGKAVYQQIRDLMASGDYATARTIATQHGWEHVVRTCDERSAKARDLAKGTQSLAQRGTQRDERAAKRDSAVTEGLAETAPAPLPGSRPERAAKPSRAKCATHNVFVSNAGICKRCQALADGERCQQPAADTKPAKPAKAPNTSTDVPLPARSKDTSGTKGTDVPLHKRGVTVAPANVTSENDLLLHWAMLVAMCVTRTDRNWLRGQFEMVLTAVRADVRRAASNGDKALVAISRKRASTLEALVLDLQSTTTAAA